MEPEIPTKNEYFKVECPNCGVTYTICEGKIGDIKFIKCDECGQEFIKTLKGEN